MKDTKLKKSFSIIKVKNIQYFIVALLLLFTLFLSIYTKQQNDEKERAQFELVSQQITLLIRDRMDYYTQLLLGGVGLFVGSDNVTREDWRKFVSVQHIDSKFLGIQGIGYSKVVRAQELDEHIESIRLEGFSDYTIKPSTKRDFYTSIIYLEPFNERNKRAFGYDMYSQEIRQKAMTKAIETAAPSLSGKVRLVQENGDDEQAGFLLYIPVYDKNMPRETKEQRHRAIKGFVYAPFRAKDFFNNITGSMTDKIGVEIYDTTDMDDSSLLIRSHTSEKIQNALLKFQQTLEIENNLWIIKYSALKSSLSKINELTPWIILLFGILLSILLFLLLKNLLKMEAKHQKYIQDLQALSFRKSLALNAGTIGIWEWDYESNSLIWDKHMYEIYGIEEKDTKSTYSMWSDSIIPSEKALVQEKIAHAVKTNSEYNAKFWILTPDGKKKYIHAIGLSELDSSGKAIRMVGTNNDITDLKLLEVQLTNEQEALLQVKTTGFIHLKGRRFLWTNAAFEEMLGYERGELHNEISKKIYADEVTFLEYGKVLAKALSKEGTFSGELNAVKKDGTPITILAAITKLKDTTDEAMGVIMDITRQKQLEQNLQEEVALKTEENFKQFQALQHQSKLASMGEMIGAIAHQWRQPLNEVSIRIQKIKYKFNADKIDEEYINDFIEKNTQTINFMSKTIDDFRNFFRIDKEKKEFSLKDAIQEIINIQGAQLKNYNIALEFSGDDSVFVGYKTEFQQVILNLISNAKDAFISNKIEEPKLLVKLEKNKITLEDNAGGIDKKIIDRIFEPYFTTKQQGEGTGMGLYMSKMIIEDNMKAHIEIKNKNDGIEVCIDTNV